MIEVQTLKDLEEAFTTRTAMATGQINLANDGNPFTLEQYIAAAHKHGVPVVMDCAGCLTVLGVTAGNHIVSFHWVQVHANRLFELGEGGLSLGW